MDKQTFTSIQATTNTSRFAAAVFRKGEGLVHILSWNALVSATYLLCFYRDCDGTFLASFTFYI